MISLLLAKAESGFFYARNKPSIYDLLAGRYTKAAKAEYLKRQGVLSTFSLGARGKLKMISRRAFLKASVAAASGLILPSWLVHAERFIKVEALPYLEKNRNYLSTLFVASRASELGYELYLGDPREDPCLDLTWQEFIDTYDAGLEEFESRVEDESTPPELQDKVDENLVMYHWEYSEFTGGKAFRFLRDIDLGPEFDDGSSAGSIDFYDGFSPANDCQLVAAPDLLSLSLLQKKLNHIDGTIKLELIDI